MTTEDDPLDPSPLPAMRQTQDAIRHLEEAVVDGGRRRAALRRPLRRPGDAQIELVRKRRFPIVGDGGGVWSFVHLDDAAAATVLALDRGAPGVYNVVDDDPAPVREWLPVLAEALGAKPPRHVPRWLARLAAGEVGVAMMTEVRGRVERQGEARARLDAALPELARRVPGVVRRSPAPASRPAVGGGVVHGPMSGGGAAAWAAPPTMLNPRKER